MTNENDLLDNWDGDTRLRVFFDKWTVHGREESGVIVTRGNVLVAQGHVSDWDLAMAYSDHCAKHPEETSWLVTEDWKNESWEMNFETIEGWEEWIPDHLWVKYFPDEEYRPLYCAPCDRHYCGHERRKMTEEI